VRSSFKRSGETADKMITRQGDPGANNSGRGVGRGVSPDNEARWGYGRDQFWTPPHRQSDGKSLRGALSAVVVFAYSQLR